MRTTTGRVWRAGAGWSRTRRGPGACPALLAARTRAWGAGRATSASSRALRRARPARLAATPRALGFRRASPAPLVRSGGGAPAAPLAATRLGTARLGAWCARPGTSTTRLGVAPAGPVGPSAASALTCRCGRTRPRTTGAWRAPRAGSGSLWCAWWGARRCGLLLLLQLLLLLPRTAQGTPRTRRTAASTTLVGPVSALRFRAAGWRAPLPRSRGWGA